MWLWLLSGCKRKPRETVNKQKFFFFFNYLPQNCARSSQVSWTWNVSSLYPRSSLNVAFLDPAAVAGASYLFSLLASRTAPAVYESELTWVMFFLFVLCILFCVYLLSHTNTGNCSVKRSGRGCISSPCLWPREIVMRTGGSTQHMPESGKL